MVAVPRNQVYPLDEWKVIESQFDYDTNYRDETVFALGNGLIGVRGGYEEGYSGPVGTTGDATFINGFYESGSVVHAEPAYGLATTRQTLLNVTNGKIINLWVDGEPFTMTPTNVLEYRRELDLKEGILKRLVLWKTASGKELLITTERLVSFTHNRLLAIQYTVTPQNFSGPITITSALDGEVYNRRSANDPRVGAFFSGQALLLEDKIKDGDFFALKQRTKTSEFALVCGMTNRLTAQTDYTVEVDEPKQRIEIKFTIEAQKGQPVTLEKFVSYFHSKRELDDMLPGLAKTEVRNAAKAGYAKVRNEQVEYMTRFWNRAFVDIEGDTALVQGLRFNLFHLLQSTGRDGKTNIAAKGVVGEGYEGHYFWDTETYIMPVFLHTLPELAKSLLEQRHSILPKARMRALELSLNGALYPWRTIDGEELSTYFPAGTAQYHINADIAYAVKQYYLSTGDKDFMYTKGAEMVWETARTWMGLGDYIEDKGFCINCVTGPDEYNALVNNNTYTNLMAKDHLEFAVSIAREMKREVPRQYQKLAIAISLDETELGQWARAAENMYVHYDKRRNLYGQDDSFLEKGRWDFKGLPVDKRPFNMNFHYLHIYRYQVLKQADLVLALFLQGERFTRADKVRVYDYYEPITSHDSSLSLCTHSIVAGELGYKKQAYEYYFDTVRVDLDDIHMNVRDGIHAAAMAGSWMGLVYGFGGLRERGTSLHFAPWLPDSWKGYAFNVTQQNVTVRLTVSRDEVQYEMIEGTSLVIYHYGERIVLKSGFVEKRALIPEVRAALFDLDGIITDTAEFHYVAWKRLADELNVPFDRAYNEQLKGVSRLDSLELILSKSQRQYTADQKLEMADRKNGYYVELLQRLTPADVLPGIRELLEELRSRGIKIALCSASKNAVAVIQQLAVQDLFDVVVDPATLALGKPDPEIFLRAAEDLGIPYECCVGIEDAAAGVTAIKKAGMFAIGVGTREALKEADLIVPATDQLTANVLINRSLSL